jgi:hypothetical protein
MVLYLLLPFSINTLAQEGGKDLPVSETARKLPVERFDGAGFFRDCPVL